MPGIFRFSTGPWNIHEGADMFGPEVRSTRTFAKKIELLKNLGFDGIQFHDDDAVPDYDEVSHNERIKQAKSTKKLLDDHGLVAEFVAPRLWEHPNTVDGGYTSSSARERNYAIKRSLTAIDIANELDTKLLVLWLAREGTIIRESKDSRIATEQLVEAINIMLEYDPDIKICIEPKPNEPVDHAFIPTTGHAIALGHLTIDPDRVGVNIESAHAVLAGIDPSDEMGFALAHKKLWTVHLNDQNGLKFDQDKTFASVDLRRAFNQVRILDKYNYGEHGEFIGIDVKAMRTQNLESSTKHLRNSISIFQSLLEKVRSIDEKKMDDYIESRDYEELEFYVISHLLAT